MRIAICVQGVPLVEAFAALQKLPFIGAVTLAPSQIRSDTAAWMLAGYHVGAFVYTLEDATAALEQRLNYVFISDEPNAYGRTPAQYLETARPISDYLRSSGFTGIIAAAGLAEEFTGWLGTPRPAETYLRELVKLERGEVFDAFTCNPFKCGHSVWRDVFNRVARGRLVLCAGWSFQSHGPGWHWFAALPGIFGGWRREFAAARGWTELQYSGIWCLRNSGGEQWPAEYGLVDAQNNLSMLGSHALAASSVLR